MKKLQINKYIFLLSIVLIGSLTNLHAQKIDTFADPRDGKKYKIVNIGTQTWMAENLNFKMGNSKCYKNDESNCQKYGRLYDWEEAKKACPPGWHLPSNEEWQTLVDFAGGYEVAGKKLKAESGWQEECKWTERTEEKIDNRGRITPATVTEHNHCGTDEYGFSALPGGNGYGSSFDDVGDGGSWWSATEGNASYAWGRIMYYLYSDVIRYVNSKTDLFSVRCLKD
jgi:uncharacterized protein (TIGR02145 family)